MEYREFMDVGLSIVLIWVFLFVAGIPVSIVWGFMNKLLDPSREMGNAMFGGFKLWLFSAACLFIYTIYFLFINGKLS